MPTQGTGGSEPDFRSCNAGGVLPGYGGEFRAAAAVVAEQVADLCRGAEGAGPECVPPGESQVETERAGQAGRVAPADDEVAVRIRAEGRRRQAAAIVQRGADEPVAPRPVQGEGPHVPLVAAASLPAIRVGLVGFRQRVGQRPVPLRRGLLQVHFEAADACRQRPQPAAVDAELGQRQRRDGVAQRGCARVAQGGRDLGRSAGHRRAGIGNGRAHAASPAVVRANRRSSASISAFDGRSACTPWPGASAPRRYR